MMDSLLKTDSGHSGQRENGDTDEDDGRDECESVLSDQFSYVLQSRGRHHPNGRRRITSG